MKNPDKLTFERMDPAPLPKSPASQIEKSKEELQGEITSLQFALCDVFEMLIAATAGGG